MDWMGHWVQGGPSRRFRRDVTDELDASLDFHSTENA